MKRPICLWMTSRSRSSLVSKIFANHGVWWGNTYAMTKGYQMYENQNIKRIQKEIIKPKKGILPFCEELELTEEVVNKFHESLERYISQQMQSIDSARGKWSMKTGVEYFNAWKDLNPYNVFIKRDPDGVAKSIVEKGIGGYQQALAATHWRYNYMDRIQDRYGGVFVNTDKIINGDYTDIKQAIAYCGIEYSKPHVEKSINGRPNFYDN
tara:strand:- start:913 stop:1542 length:630 start_codon:yes stop_codon:yes gene_type:complete